MQPLDDTCLTLCGVTLRCQGQCYDGVCQPTSKVIEVKTVGPILSNTWTNPQWIFYGMNGSLPANNTQWYYHRLIGTASGGIQTLSGEVGLSSPAIVNGSIVSTAPVDPRTSSPITTALRLINPRLNESDPVIKTERAEASVWYRNNTPNHPPGLFNGMKVSCRALVAVEACDCLRLPDVESGSLVEA